MKAQIDTAKLFADRYPRYTRQIAFFEGSIDEVVAGHDAWWFGLDRVHAVATPRSEPLESILAKGFTEDLLVACEPPWTAMFAPNLEGGPPAVISREVGLRSTYIRDHPGEMVQFTVNDRDRRRVIMAYEDGGHWAFHQEGVPFPFEDVDRYSSPRKRDRLTSKLVHDYAAALGIRFADTTFYAGERVSLKMEGLGSILKRVVLGRIRGS